MTGRQGRGQGNNNPRQNEYFVPRDGIDREVITADICRYLGNDALVRPGTYHDDNSGRTIQGYYITAYRNLTTAMIDDLKNDSARWEQERRKHQSGAVRYQDSAIHRMGGSSDYGAPSAGYASGSRDNYGAEAQAPSYPGSNAPGYSASRQSTATATAYGQPGYAATQQYPPAGAAYPPATEVRYATGTGTAGLGAGGMPGYSTPMAQVPYTDPVPYNVRQAEPYRADYSMEDAPSATGNARTPTGYTTSSRTGFPATTLAPTQAGYGYAATSGPNSGYAPHPVDNFYGRGGFSSTSSAAPFSDSVANPAAGVGYSPEQPPYDDQSPVPRGSATSPGAQGQGGRHERERERGERGERERDRDRRERDSRKPHHYGR